jgi:hypothetical protein
MAHIYIWLFWTTYAHPMWEVMNHHEPLTSGGFFSPCRVTFRDQIWVDSRFFAQLLIYVGLM